MTSDGLIPGAYYRFERDTRHCVEGIAFADPGPGGQITLRDTFWGPQGTDQFMVGHNNLSPDELTSVELLFDPADGWRKATMNGHPAFFHAENVRTVTSQHGQSKEIWVRDNARPSKAIEIQCAQEELTRLRAAAEAAIRRVEWQAMQVGRLVAEQQMATEQEEAADFEEITDHSEPFPHPHPTH